jgi:periplasmic protein TonB
MRTDLAIGALVSLAVHGTLLLGTPRPPRVFTVTPEPPEIGTEIVMPPLPPEETEQPVEELKEAAAVQPVPVSLPDVPSAELTVFRMPIQPPPPPGVPTTNLTSIPVNRTPGIPAGKLAGVFDPRDLEQQPNLTSPIPPVYPFEMRRAGISGDVIVEFIVTADGRTSNATVVRSTHREFEKAALDAVAKWQFRPGKKAGRAVNTRVQQLIDFNLNEQ